MTLEALAQQHERGLKHLIGRPRPKFAHSGEWQLTPSWASGLDSFPSGHSAASFAVATVLAKRFPAVGPLCLGIAAFVALSRILRGSHFPTDVFGGAVVGAGPVSTIGPGGGLFGGSGGSSAGGTKYRPRSLITTRRPAGRLGRNSKRARAKYCTV
ncbi:MAG: phosphatase PAP2 family protein [Blastochloris sp.]|nr:phosphatase PAP2 family protein [Blastochloris sp.]